MSDKILNSKRPLLKKKRIRFIRTWLLVFVWTLGVNHLAAEKAHAGKFLETVGTSVLLGTVLGASTLPFYDQPSANTRNLLYGAFAGLTVGLGLWVVGLLQKSDEEKHYFPDAHRRVHLTRNDSRIHYQDFSSFVVHFRYQPEVQFTDPALQLQTPRVWLPVVSLKL